MTRHATIKHGIQSEKDVQKLDIATVRTLLIDTQKSLRENECFTKHLPEEIANFTSNLSEDLLNILNRLYNRLLKTKDAGFYSTFYSIVVMNVSIYLPELERPASTLLTQKLADKLFNHFKHPKEFIPNAKVPPVTEK